MRKCLLAIVLAVASGPLLAADAAKKVSDIQAVTCKEVMSSGDHGRQMAMAFMHGYISGKSGKTSIDQDALAAITDKVQEHCLDNPTAKFVSAFESLSK